MKRFSGKFLFIIVLTVLILTACNSTPLSTAQNSAKAPEFTLPNSLGGEVSLADYLGRQPVLLFFHMAVG